MYDYKCHGPDAKTRMAGLRLDLRDALFQLRTSGVPIAPGDPERSLIYQRITHQDVTRRMPPKYSHKEWSGKQIDLIRRQVSSVDGVEGVVLRYGYLYGRGTAYAADGSVAAGEQSVLGIRLEQGGCDL